MDDVPNDPLDRVLDHKEQLDVGDVVSKHPEEGGVAGELQHSWGLGDNMLARIREGHLLL